MINLKKSLALTVGTVMALGLFAGCNRGGASGSGAGSSGLTYNGQDVSQPVELVYYILGDKNGDAALVEGEINKILKEKINAAIVTKNIPLSDYQTKYSLTIAGGEKIDLIYTSSWAYYQSEANKGAFAEITENVLTNYMPLTKQHQEPASLAQARIAGKTYFVPVNMANVSAIALIIRGDLREKYGLPEIKTIADLEAYYRAISDDRNSGVSFGYNASQQNDLMRTIQFLQGNNFIELSGALQNYFTYKYSDNVRPEDLLWFYSSPEDLEWAKRQKRFADMGVWSRSAIANATDVRDSFVNGTSASFVQNLGTIGSVASQVSQTHPEWKPELVDLYPETNRFYLAFTGDGFAVTASSQNQARAFMALDLLKFDERLYLLARNGIEGVHYTRPGPGLWAPGPSYDNWPFGSAFAWGLKNNMYDLVREDTFPDHQAIADDWKSRALASPTASFAFDDSAVQNELANLQSVYIQYVPLLDLGLAQNTEATLAEFQRQAEVAGLAKITAEIQRQFKTHLDSLK
jgi:putative aldouronate transport system substrate-binding protein